MRNREVSVVKAVPKGSRVLFWASSYAFAAKMSQILTASSMNWAIFSSLKELDGKANGEWAALLMDGDSEGVVEAVGRLRQKTEWIAFPIILVGGDPLTELSSDPFLRQIPVPQTAQQFESYLNSETLGTVPPPGPDPLSQRKSYRHICNASIEALLEIKIIDISEGGAQIECPFNLPPDTILQLSLRSLNPEFTRTLPFRVIRNRPCLPPKKAFRLHGGFEGLDAQLMVMLRRTMLRIQISNRQGMGSRVL